MKKAVTGPEPAVPGSKMHIAPTASQWEKAWTDGTAPHPEVHREMIEAITFCLDVRGKHVLEVGSGTGHDSVELSSLGANAVALDLTQVALELTRETAAENNAPVDLIVGDTLKLPFRTGAFDLVFSQGLIEHFSDPAPVIREQTRVIRSGGYLLVDVPQRYSLYTLEKRRLMRSGKWFAGWETEFSLSQLSRLLQSSGVEPVVSYGYGYYPAAACGIRNLHTIDRRRLNSVRFPKFIAPVIERGWRALERSPLYHRWLSNVGVIAQKS
jgi:ubiquinone/menaquinone biosynthesis C-methylase UbiE